MPYKRKVRVIFVASGDICRAQMAHTIAQHLGRDCLETRAFTLQAHALTPFARSILNALGITPEQASQQWQAEQLAWADLIIALDEAADAALSPLPATAQKRCYPFLPAQDMAGFERLRCALEQRIAGMLGGVRMMA